MLVATVLAASLLVACERSSPAPAQAPDQAPAQAPRQTPRAESPEHAIDIARAPEGTADLVHSGWSLALAGWDRALWADTPAFALRPGESLHPGVAAESLAGQYTGVLDITSPGAYAVGIEVEGGSASLSLIRADGTMAARAHADPNAPAAAGSSSLAIGATTVIIKFARAGDEPFRLHATWSKTDADGFVDEPIPVRVVRPPDHARADVDASRLATRGRVLLGEFGCTRCHTMPNATAVLARAAPNLGKAASRASRAWLESWIADPQAHKPGSGMPTILGAADSSDARDIAAYLATLSTASEPVPPAEPAAIDAGRILFHRVGCVACHGSIEPPIPGPAPFGDLRGKYGQAQASALAGFLQDPLATHPGGRMPSMSLDAREAESVAAYLIASFGAPKSESAVPAPDAQAAARGAAALVARRCVNCHALGHDLEDPEPAPFPRPLAELDPARGCLDPNDRVSPRYSLSDDDRRALSAGIAEANRSLGVPAPIDFARRTTLAMGCARCHELAGEGGPRDSIRALFACDAQAELGDEGRFPPTLDGVGGKLHTAWLAEVLTKQGRARPYMATRMPQFGPGRVGMLPTLLASRDGHWPDSDPGAAPADASVLAGRRLVGSGGLNCISCHVWAESPPAGTPGPDLSRMSRRIRADWWAMYARDPARSKPGTRMSNFFAGGASPVKDVLAGDPDAQIAAIWEYLSLGAAAPPPAGLPGVGDRLLVGDRPIVMRTFLKDAGTRAIAVGFPMGLHVAYDARECRLVSAWRGDFLDASGAWAGRAGKVTEGRGRTVWSAPPGPFVVIGDRPVDWPAEGLARFAGYTLDAGGVPTFESLIGTARIRERVEPADAGRRLVRAVEVEGVPPGTTLWLNVGNARVRAERGAVIAEPGIDGIAGFEAAAGLRVMLESTP